MAQHGDGGKRDGLPHGAFAKIARRLRPKVSTQHVREVWLGNRKSARVASAIARFQQRLQETDAVTQADTDSLSGRAA